MLLLLRNIFLASICFLLVIEPTISVSAPAPTTSTSTVAVSKGAPPKVTPSNPNKLVSDFCRQRRTVNDRQFCLKILTSNPKTPAKDYPSMLKTALSATLSDAEKVLDYFKTDMKSKTTNPKLKPVLNDCIQMYEIVVNEFKGISINIGVDSSLVKLYSRVANDEIKGCENIVLNNEDIQGIKPISNRNKITLKFGALVEDLAKLV